MQTGYGTDSPKRPACIPYSRVPCRTLSDWPPPSTWIGCTRAREKTYPTNLFCVRFNTLEMTHYNMEKKCEGPFSINFEKFVSHTYNEEIKDYWHACFVLFSIELKNRSLLFFFAFPNIIKFWELFLLAAIYWKGHPQGTSMRLNCCMYCCRDNANSFSCVSISSLTQVFCSQTYTWTPIWSFQCLIFALQPSTMISLPLSHTPSFSHRHIASPLPLRG